MSPEKKAYKTIYGDNRTADNIPPILVEIFTNQPISKLLHRCIECVCSILRRMVPLRIKATAKNYYAPGRHSFTKKF